ncbi:MAG: leucine-rich repeat domain-containing protein [Promethearchaeota archaeon]
MYDLDLGSNKISKIKGLDSLKNLYTIDLRNKQISTLEDWKFLMVVKHIFLRIQFQEMKLKI